PARRPHSGQASVARFLQLRRIARSHHLTPLRRLDFSRAPESSALRVRQAEGMRHALEEAGGAFVKMGQMLSTRDDLLPAEWLRALSQLQKNVKPAPWPAVRRMLENEWETGLKDIFAEFDETPLASASIAQVHKARLRDGSVVAVKVRRPGIVPLIRRDVHIALRMAGLLARTNAQARRLGIEQVARQYTGDLLRQTDFRLEAANLVALTEAQERGRADDQVRLPRLYAGLSTSSVLVMEFLPGETLSAVVDGRHGRAAGREHRDDLTEVLRTVVRTFLDELIFDGVYHADLHPGNIMIGPDDSPAFIDFGSVGRLSRDLRQTVQDLLIGYLAGDTRRIADAILTMSSLPDGADEREFRSDVSSFVTYRLGPGARISISTVDAAVEMLAKHRLALPPEFVAAARAFAVLEATARNLQADFDTLQEAKRLTGRVVSGRMTRAGIRQFTAAGLSELLPGLRRLPRRLDRITAALEEGRLNVNLRLLADRRDRRLLMSFVRQAVLTVIGIVAGVQGVLTLAAAPPAHPGLIRTATAGLILCTVAALAFVGVGFDMWRTRRRG
ncbi:MAG TPA: AarF/UbiB family protein, partial [Microbacteriaceae bacterium]|nr:AarF/UbiB family protein [Microbacteriaceae bacterium]